MPKRTANRSAIDLERARRDGYKPEDVIGQVPVGFAPIALTLSPDGKWLYTTSQVALPDWNWPKACKPEGTAVPASIVTNPEGAVIVVDVERAQKDPAHAVAARVPAGCSPVRMSISPKGDRVYVTARNNNALLEFDTSKLISDGAHAMVGIAPAGDAPVPVMVVDKGRKVVVGNSNRFAGGDAPQSLLVYDASKLGEGLKAVQGTIPAGSFPREMAVSADEKTLFVTNFGSNSLQVMDVARLPIDSKLPPELAKNADALAHRHDNKPVAVDPVVLRRYIGVYRAETGQPAIIDVNGSDLTAKLSTAPASTALPESDTKFFAMGMEIEFPKVAEGGHAGHLTLRQGQRETVLRRLDDESARPFLEAAAAFAKRMKDKVALPGSEAALRKLIADLQAGKPDETMFAPGGQQFVAQLQPLVSEMGTVTSVTFMGVGPAGPDIYEVKSSKGTWAFRIWLADDGKVERAVINALQQ